MCILFFLPGSAFPNENWLDAIYFDKMVHIGLFAVLMFLWRSSFNLEVNNYNLLLLFSALLYGVTVEFIQKYWIPNRSFDLYDVLADMTGSVLGLIIWLRVYRKNKPL
jgi:VanZ family protein